MSQRLRKEGNARINKVSAIRPGEAKILEKVCISRYYESLETDLNIAENACCIDYTDTRLSRRVYWLSTGHTPHWGTPYYGCEDTLGFDIGFAWASLLILRIHPWVAPESKIQWFLVTLHNTGWLDHCQVQHGRFAGVPILDPVEVQEEYGHIASCYEYLQWHVQSYGWHYASIR